MYKTFLIIKREYLSRVRNKTFLLSTFLLPLVFLLFIFGTAFLSTASRKKNHKIAIVHAPAFFRHNIKSDAFLQYDFPDADTSDYTRRGYEALLDLNNDSTGNSFILYSEQPLDITIKEAIENSLNNAYTDRQLERNGISRHAIDSIQAQHTHTLAVATQQEGQQVVPAEISSGIGFTCGILIYITLLVFGAMVMRGVMEEKRNRIAEVIISSVRPFQLMMGKIIGIAAVGLTQFFLWIALIIVLTIASGYFLTPGTLQQAQEAAASLQSSSAGTSMAVKAMAFQQLLGMANWWIIVTWFLFYFLGGFLFYAALFASIGSAVNDDTQETQVLLLPVTMPIIFSFIILTSHLTTPNSSIMVWASIIPFSSPIVMMGRIPEGVPFWQLGLSAALLIAGFMLTTWLAAKVYRTGILLYGKKISWKEIGKWAFRNS